MSGGEYNYIYQRIEEAADQLLRNRRTTLRLAFAKHMTLVAEAMHEIEWEDSGDGGSEEEAIRKCLAPGAEIEAAREALQEAMTAASEVLAMTEGKR